MSFKPIFEKGSILKQHMLEALRDYPYDYVSTLYANRGEGIINGFDITIDAENNVLYLEKGVVKLSGQIYFSTRRIPISLQEEENYVFLNVTSSRVDGGEGYSIEIIQKKEADVNEFEIFRYVKNADIKEIEKIDDICNSPMNRIDFRNVKKSVIGGSTLCDKYFEIFGKYIISSSNANPIDIAFAYQCLNGINNVQVVNLYFGKDNMSNSEIIDAIKKKVSKLEKSMDEEIREENVVVKEKKMVIS